MEKLIYIFGHFKNRFTEFVIDRLNVFAIINDQHTRIIKTLKMLVAIITNIGKEMSQSQTKLKGYVRKTQTST